MVIFYEIFIIKEFRMENYPSYQNYDSPEYQLYLEDVQRRRSAREQRRKRIRRNRIIALVIVLIALTLIISGISHLVSVIFHDGNSAGASENNPQFLINQPASYITFASYDDDTVYLGGELASEFAILINLDTNEVVVAKNAEKQMLPASMTKVMTAWLACEAISDYSDTFTMRTDIIDPYYRKGLTTSGFKGGETITMTDLLHTTILYSAADSATGLALSTYETEEAFIKAMNERFQLMGFENTVFTNVSGAYDKNHYTTAHEMALIMANAVQNEDCFKVLSALRYTSSSTEQHPDGTDYINQFLYRLQNRELNGATAVAAKSGYLTPSGSTACSYGFGASGQAYVCVTAKAQTSWKTVYDHEYLYANYAK